MFNTYQTGHYSVEYNLKYIISNKNALEIEGLAVSHQPWSKSEGEHDKEDVDNYNGPYGSTIWQVPINCRYFYMKSNKKKICFSLYLCIENTYPPSLHWALSANRIVCLTSFSISLFSTNQRFTQLSCSSDGYE